MYRRVLLICVIFSILFFTLPVRHNPAVPFLGYRRTIQGRNHSLPERPVSSTIVRLVMRPLLAVFSCFLSLFTLHEPVSAQSVARPPVSSETQACLDCHENATPGIVADWLTSRHAHTSVEMGLAKPAVERRVSATSVAEELKRNVVGCYAECHTLRKEKHPDAFDHFGYTINVIVSPTDCQTCHPTEVEQFSHSKKAHAIGNLTKNPVYSLLVETVTRQSALAKDRLHAGTSSANAKNVSCLACHGTIIEVKGKRSLDTEAGPIEVPNLVNWPNMGVGRLNPDGSAGSCYRMPSSSQLRPSTSHANRRHAVSVISSSMFPPTTSTKRASTETLSTPGASDSPGTPCHGRSERISPHPRAPGVTMRC